ncbi:MAG: helix-turn-helix transcriptional regulator [Agathobacter sp.]|nr:helix-turn-helix transcriptional regulator [Agathobacter sp.]
MVDNEKIQDGLIKQINELCNEKNYDYITLSRKSGVPLSTILNIIKGNSKNPGIYTIFKLCKGFEITPAEFFEKIEKTES